MFAWTSPTAAGRPLARERGVADARRLPQTDTASEDRHGGRAGAHPRSRRAGERQRSPGALCATQEQRHAVDADDARQLRDRQDA